MIARAQASGTYLPIVLGINAVYILLFLGSKGFDSFLNFWTAAGVLSVWGLQYFAYGGILDNAANRNPNDKSLVGGSSLDLLGLTVAIQFGSLWYPRVYWALGIVPIWGGWTLYSTAFGGNSGKNDAKSSASPGEPSEEDKALAEKRQKRSERRRQKRA